MKDNERKGGREGWTEREKRGDEGREGD